MTRTDLLRSWFVAPPLAGKWVILWILVSLPVATVIRSSMHCSDAIGDCCAPFFVFVLLTAILLGSLAAVVAAIASMVVSILLFSQQAHPMQMGEGSELLSAILFALYCVLIICSVEYVRRAFARFSRIATTKETSSGVIFSLEKGQAWASWPGSPSPVRLGPEHEVTAMMEDFIAQVELGHRLAERAAERAQGSNARVSAEA